MTNNGKTKCGFENEIVSYIYDEMSGAERLEFEGHLSGCSGCTDEFAAISDARFSLFEWQKEEFADLPTPEITIPYVRSRKLAEPTESIGVLAAIRGWVASANLAVAAAVALIVVAGLSFVVLRFSGINEQPLALNAPVESSEKAQNTPIRTDESAIKKPDRLVTPAVAPTNDKNVHALNVVLRRNPTNRTRTLARTEKHSIQPVASAAPVLSGYDAEEDRSLRLADLFAEMDG